MDKVFGILGIAGGVFLALGIWLPRFRIHWRGIDEFKGMNIVCGPISQAGLALFVINFGIVLFCHKALLERYVIGLVCLATAGWSLGGVGYALDMRAQSQSFIPSPQPQWRPARSRAERTGWMFAAAGVFFLLMLLWLFSRPK